MQREPDYIYDPDDWECTWNWEDSDILAEDTVQFGDGVHRFNTLIEGPPIFAARVPISFDESGEPDETEIQWFDSEDDALAAVAKRPAAVQAALVAENPK
jgi:hypothetical protein